MTDNIWVLVKILTVISVKSFLVPILVSVPLTQNGFTPDKGNDIYFIRLNFTKRL